MTLDEQLREMLSQRAQDLTPPPAVLTGVEGRARRIRRQRQAGAVGSSVAVVLALTLLAPLVSTGAGPSPREVATTPPRSGETLQPSPTPLRTPTGSSGRPAVLGPRWDRPALSGEGLDLEVARAWAERRDLEAAEVQGEQLLLGLTPDGRTSVGAYHLWGPDGVAFEVVAQGAQGGAETARAVLVTDDEIAGAPALAVGVVRTPEMFVVVASARPGLSRLEYAADGSRFAEVPLDSTSAVLERTGPTGRAPDRVRGVFSDGSAAVEEVTRSSGAGPAVTAPPADPGGVAPADPANVVEWPVRGLASEGSSPTLAQAALEDRLGEGVRYRVLFRYGTDGGLRLTAGQAWLPGQPARSFHHSTGSTCGESLVIGPVTPESPAALAFRPRCVPGNENDTVIVVGAPEVGQVSHGEPGSEYRAAPESPAVWGGVVELELDAPEGTEHVVRILDGDGDLDDPLYEGPLDALVCGDECA